MMDWHNLILNKGHNVQIFIEEFRKKALELNVPLYSSKTLIKYVGALHNYIQCTLLLLNPTNLDEASVQAINIESMGKHAQDEEPSKNGEGLFKGNGRDKRKATTNKDEKKTLHCTNYEKDGNDQEHC